MPDWLKGVRQKAARGAGCLNYLVWRNKYMRKKTKSEIYKATVCPIMTYALEKKGRNIKNQTNVGRK